MVDGPRPRSSPDTTTRASIATALDEALATALEPALARTLLADAMSALSMSEVPDRSAPLRILVARVLVAVERRVGEDAAESVASELASLLRIVDRIDAVATQGAARSGSMPREVHRAITTPVLGASLVLVATQEPDLLPRLRRMLPDARVEVASTLEGLQFQMLRRRPERAVVLIDARTERGVPTGTPVAHSRAPGAAAVIVWGSHAPEREDWAWADPERIVRCTDEVELVDLACLLRHGIRRVA